VKNHEKENNGRSSGRRDIVRDDCGYGFIGPDPYWHHHHHGLALPLNANFWRRSIATGYSTEVSQIASCIADAQT